MKTIKLYRPIVGKCINVANFGPARIASVDTKGYECFQGGIGVYEAIVDLIPEDVLKQANCSGMGTETELALCEKIMNESLIVQ